MNIKRIGVEVRYSDVAIHNGVAYLAGQVANIIEDESKDIYSQTHDVLQQVDELLDKCGSDKSHILRAEIFLSNMSYYEAMNEVWDNWVSDTQGNAPPRATVEAKLARPEYKIEIVITAAVKGAYE